MPTPTKNKFVGQGEIKYIEIGAGNIGSFGAGPCVICVIYHPKFGILCGHIDAITTNETIEKYLKIFTELAHIREKITSCDLKVILTNSGEKDNAVLRKRIIGVFNKKGITQKPRIIESTQLIVKGTNPVFIETDFVPLQRFPDVQKDIDKCANELLDIANACHKKADKYLKKNGGLPPRLTYGDKYR